jgi:hypothetical protein
MTQIEIEAIQAQRRAEHEAKMQELHAQEVEIQKQKNILKADFKAGNKLLSALATPSANSIRNDRKRDGYKIQRIIHGMLEDFESKYHDPAHAAIHFNVEDNGTLTLSIVIPSRDEFDYPCQRCKNSLKISDESLVCSKLTCKGEHLIVDKGEIYPPCNGEFLES